MITVHKEEVYINDNPIKDKYFSENSIFFDIETTGFSPKTSTLYLIGLSYRVENTIHVVQYFAEESSEEKIIIQKFIEKLTDFNTIITFNGVGFDIPFIIAKCNSYSIPQHFSKYKYLDIFKEVSSVKKILNLGNYKQKTIERFLGILRDDKYNGGELINIYQEYVKTPTSEALDLLLLHNYEDVLGMNNLLPVLSYKELFNNRFDISATEIKEYTDYHGKIKKELYISLLNHYSVPKHIFCKSGELYISIKDKESSIRIPIVEDTLYFFYPNYKDYYYLPDEDTAIHKSIAKYVDCHHREKCHACNCYTRKEGEFLVQYSNIMNPAFRKVHNSKESYFEMSDDFLSSKELLKKYVESILNTFVSNK